MVKFKLIIAVVKVLLALSMFVLLMRIDDSEISKGGRAIAFLFAVFMGVDGMSSYSESLAARKKVV